MQLPAINPITTGRGTEVAGAENETPAMKITASRPSRSTVMKGSMNKAYFSAHRLKAFFFPSLVTGVSSRLLASLTRHFSCILETRRRAAPRTEMMMVATRAKEPSQ